MEAEHIELLESGLSSHLRSSLILPTLPSIVLALAHNSLDARATAIRLEVDLSRWTIKCVDNGGGVKRELLDAARRGGSGAGIGARYVSASDRQPGEACGGKTRFGWRGEALASMAQLGLVQLTSWPALSRSEEKRRHMEDEWNEQWTLLLKVSCPCPM